MWFAPKIATVIDVVSRPQLRNAFGGAGRFIASTVTETIFFLMLSPIMWFGHRVLSPALCSGAGSAGPGRRATITLCHGAMRRNSFGRPLGWSSLLILAFTVPAAIPYALSSRAGLRCDPARGHHLMAGRRPRADARRHRRAAGRERAAFALRKLGLPAIEAAALRTR